MSETIAGATIVGFTPLAVKGRDGTNGADGQPGPPGPAPTITVGSVTSLAPGTPPSLTLVPTGTGYTLNIAIPRGDVGPQGNQGTAGTNGTGGSGAVSSVAGRTGAVTLTADDTPDGSTNKAYTSAEKTKLAAITGSNTGDETTATIKTKLGVTTLSGVNTGDQSIPTSLPPSGAAGGGLGGTYPNPSVTTVAAGATGPLSATDTSVTNARTPTAHASTHASGGSDAISIAASQVTSGTFAIGRLATGTPDGTKFVRDDGTLVTPSGGGSTSGVTPVSGRYYTTPVASFATVTPTVGALKAAPIRLAASTTFSRIGLGIWSAGTTGSLVRLGIYNDSGGNPGSLVVDAGTIDSTVSGAAREITISQTLAAGRYWLAAVALVAAPNWYVVANAASNEVGNTTAPSNTNPTPPGLTASATVSGALPTPFGTLAASNNDSYPLVYLKAA